MEEKEELKTLKDLKNTEEKTNRICCCGSTKESHGLEWIRESAIKQEAIKILKADTKDLCEFLVVEELTNEEIKVIDLVIKKIFNISEEDLQ